LLVTLSAGTRLGPYEIEAPIGSGQPFSFAFRFGKGCFSAFVPDNLLIVEKAGP
jgi:hypothetical protein